MILRSVKLSKPKADVLLPWESLNLLKFFIKMLLGFLEVWFLIKLGNKVLEDRGLQRLYILPSSIAMHLVRHLGGIL